MAEKDLLLSIDNGTQSLKALVFDAGGNLIAREQVLFTPYFSDQPGWAEQDPQVFWNALCQACQKIFTTHGIDKSRIAGVSLTTQRGTVVNVDKNGSPLRPAILWLDQRKCYDLPPLGGLWGLLFRVTGLAGTLAYFQSETEANWISKNQPEIWAQTHKFLLLSGYLNFRLTGEYKDSVGSQVGYLPFDYKRLRWARAWNWKWRCVPVDPDQLPQLVTPGQIIGTVSRQASRETGIPACLPVFAAAADKACEVIGSGSLDGVAAEDLFEHLIKDIPPGSMGLMLQPFWTPGIRTPGPEAKGAIIGFGDVHTRAHLYRSILEGLAYALREGKERIERRSRTPITSLRVSGGGSQSDLALQLTADIFGLPTARPHLYETSGLGAAIDTAVGLGIHSDFETAVGAMTRSGERFEPDPSNHRLYDELYQKVYKRMYRRLRPLYKKIREITGYPE
ncbi:MAG: carbohydrate kinase [Desulfosarcina sp.]|nr:carbohydrate kinase [Desulfosarcina sp.]MBC2766132.1 carbohydrate kinase [Desulfosarcina sp.]